MYFIPANYRIEIQPSQVFDIIDKNLIYYYCVKGVQGLVVCFTNNATDFSINVPVYSMCNTYGGDNS